jgi:hypothetical protein
MKILFHRSGQTLVRSKIEDLISTFLMLPGKTALQHLDF